MILDLATVLVACLFLRQNSMAKTTYGRERFLGSRFQRSDRVPGIRCNMAGGGRQDGRDGKLRDHILNYQEAVQQSGSGRQLSILTTPPPIVPNYSLQQVWSEQGGPSHSVLISITLLSGPLYKLKMNFLVSTTQPSGRCLDSREEVETWQP